MYDNRTYLYLKFAKDGLSDCLKLLETDERLLNQESFEKMEIWLGLSGLRLLSTGPIKNRSLDLSRAIDLARDSVLTLDYSTVQKDLVKLEQALINVLSQHQQYQQDILPKFLKLVSFNIMLAGIILLYRRICQKESIPWNYPNLDRFVVTCGSLLGEPSCSAECFSA